ncbi:MAG: metallophosphoesterase family protein [Clostridia bacterium]|nr:metallophosphoesterase family protein [Clostridia bacterium]
MSKEEIANHKWNHNKISYSSKEFLKTLNKEKLIEINNKKIYMVHFPINKEKKYHLINIDYKEKLKGIDADIFLFGHTHKPLIDYNGKYYINPGSLGCPKNVNKALAGILSLDNGYYLFLKKNFVSQ